MMKLLQWIFCGWLLLCVPGVAFSRSGGSGAAEDSSRAVLMISSEPGGLKVFNDTSFLGTTPIITDTLPAGMLRLGIFATDPSHWMSPARFDSVLLVYGDTVERHFVLPRIVHITSHPSGAEVLLGDSLLGGTPLFAILPRRAITLTLNKPLFSEQQIIVPDGLETYRAVMSPSDPDAAAFPDPLSGEVSGSAAPVIIAAGVAVLSGAASAYLKTKADRSYDEYRITSEAGTLDRVRRYDIFSGIALGVAELSLGYLIIELLSR